MADGQELANLDGWKAQHTTKVASGGSGNSNLKDENELARAGKKQVFQRNFGLISMIGFSCGLMATWEGELAFAALGTANGGPAGLIYGLLFVWLGTLSVFTVLGELSSMITTAGGQYHWVSVLAPSSAKNFLSYITGWLTVIGWIAAVTASATFGSGMILTLAALNNPEYVPMGWHSTLVSWAILLVCFAMNTILSGMLPLLETLILILHILAFCAIAIPLIYLSPRGSIKPIFTTFVNEGGWSTQALSVFVGMNGNALAFVGTDGPVHMSEEVKKASLNVPRAMFFSLLINGSLALGMMIIVLASAGDPSIYSGSSYPFIPIFANVFQSNAAATGVTAVILVIQFVTTIGGLASASRMVWSFSRDRGLPGWAFLSKVDSRSTIPLAAIALVTTAGCLLSLINVGSALVLSDIISLTLEALFSSYLICCSLLLYRRVKGQVGKPLSDGETTSEAPYTWGPWHLKGTFGILNNVFACAYLIFICFFSFWPAQTPVTAATMNYSSLVTGAVVIFSIGYYFLRAKRTYKGPIVEVAL